MPDTIRRENLRQDFGLTSAEAGFAREILKADGLQAQGKEPEAALPPFHPRRTRLGARPTPPIKAVSSQV